jgi:hypothetical protein
MNYADIVNNTYTYLEANKAASELPTIYYPNSPNDGKPQPPTGNHIAVSINPAETITLGLSTLESHSGIIQFSVRVEANHGEYAAWQIVDKIITLFARGTSIASGLDVHRKPSAFPPITDEGWYSVPVQVEYSALN